MGEQLESRVESLLTRIREGVAAPGLCTEAIELVCALEESASWMDAVPEITLQERQHLAWKEELLNHLLCPQGLSGSRADLELLLAGKLREMELQLQAVQEDATLVPAARESALSRLTDRSRWMELVSLKYLDLAAIDPLKDLFIEIDLWDQTTRMTGDEAAFAQHAQPFRASVVEEQVRDLLGHARRMLDAGESRPEMLWQMLLQVWGLQHKVAAEASASERPRSNGLLFQMAETAALLRKEIELRVAELPVRSREQLCRQWTEELHGRIDEILFLADDQPLERGYDIATALSVRLTEFEEMWRGGAAVGVDGTQATSKPKRLHPPGLRRLIRRIRSEMQEKEVQIGLERLLGHRGTVWLENTILILILGVVGLLMYEATAKPPERVVQWLVWVDTAICVVFLAEFSLRMHFAKRKLLYFRRHFFIDFLPSIPFGLIAQGLQALNYIRGARVLRFLRLPRLVRYVRVARPIVRLVRVIIFLMRGLDRMVAKQAGVLNRNVVAFARVDVGGAKSTAFRLMRLRSRSLAQWRKALADLPEGPRRHRLRRWYFALQQRLVLRSVWLSGGRGMGSDLRLAREIRLERVLETLVDLDGAQVETTLGREAAERFTRILQLFHAPLIRRLPFFAAGARLEATLDDPCEVVAAFGRRLGQFGQRLLSVVHWCADLSGTMTATQFLEMVGAAVTKWTMRPARRLILMGSAFLLVDWTFALFHFDILRNLSKPLERIMGTPLIVLGGICLLLLLIGQWFRKIASEASDFYEHTAEAHFLALMEDVKEARAQVDIETLFSRVLYPESILQGIAQGQASLVSDSVQRLCARLREAVAAADDTEADAQRQATQVRSGSEAYYWLLEDRVLALFRDYLDGALLHKNDTKTTNQLLGNLTIQKIWTERLGLTRSNRKRLDRLDLERERTLFGGPYMWFKFITHSVAQRTAKLLIEYNKQVIPLDELPFVSVEEREEFLEWLGGTGNVHRRQDGVEQTGRSYFTTEFTALNFLSSDPARDHMIMKRFGPEVVARLKRDRRMLIRNLFGTYPLHKLPKDRRSFNPYRYYQRRMARGRIFLTPFYILGAIGKGVWSGIRAVAAVAHELIDPETYSDPGENLASFDVAERKIARMRRPVFWESMRLRALFDPEYLGLTIPGVEVPQLKGTSCWDDLQWIEARDEELDFFRDLLRDREGALSRLEAYWESRGLTPLHMDTYLEALRPGLSRRRAEALRAAAVAFAVDYRGLRSCISGMEEIEALFQSVLAHPATLPAMGFFKQLIWWGKSLWRRRFFLHPDPMAEAYRKVVGWLGHSNADWRRRRILWHAFQTDAGGVRRQMMHLATSASPEAARDRGQILLDEVLSRPHSWTDEMVVLRTVQTMSVLDIGNYQAIVRSLGGYVS